MTFQVGDRVRVVTFGVGVKPAINGVVAAVRDGRMTIILDDGGEVNGPVDAPDCEYLGPAPDPEIVAEYRHARPLMAEKRWPDMLFAPAKRQAS